MVNRITPVKIFNQPRLELHPKHEHIFTHQILQKHENLDKIPITMRHLIPETCTQRLCNKESQVLSKLLIYTIVLGTIDSWPPKHN